MNLDLYHDTYDIFCQLVQRSQARIFEIGCGPGNITKYLISKRPDFNIEAIDVAQNMIRLATENNPTAHFTVMDCRNLSTIESKFDAVICGFCIPYLSKNDCEKLIKDCSFLLESWGIFYGSLIEGDYAKSGFSVGSTGNKSYVYYYQADYLENLLKENGFDLVNLNCKSYSGALEASTSHMIYIARKR